MAASRSHPICRNATIRTHTTLGDFDVLGTLDEGLGYDELFADTVVVNAAEMSLRVLALPRLIEIKERAGRPKDLAALPVLRSTLERSKRNPR